MKASHSVTCRQCGHKSVVSFDIKDCIIVKANAAIVARRRRKNGTKLTSEQAKAMQAKSAEARRAYNQFEKDAHQDCPE